MKKTLIRCFVSLTDKNFSISLLFSLTIMGDLLKEGIYYPFAAVLLITIVCSCFATRYRRKLGVENES